MVKILGKSKEPKYLLVPTVKRFFYFPEGYKKRKNAKVEGISKKGEVSPKGLVTEIEDWQDRVEAIASPSTLHLELDPDGRIRVKRHDELVAEGRFIPGQGPTGVVLPPGARTA